MARVRRIKRRRKMNEGTLPRRGSLDAVASEKTLNCIREKSRRSMVSRIRSERRDVKNCSDLWISGRYGRDCLLRTRCIPAGDGESLLQP